MAARGARAASPRCQSNFVTCCSKRLVELYSSSVLLNSFGPQPVKATDVGISFAETSDLSAFGRDHWGEAIRHPGGNAIRLSFGSKMNSAHIRRVIAAGMIGNALEWYDFAIYGYFAAQIGRNFFPHDDAVAQLRSAFGAFTTAAK